MNHRHLCIALLIAALPFVQLRADETPVPLDQAGISLQVVSDRTRLDAAESPAYYAILEHARNVSPSALQQQAARFTQRRSQLSGHDPGRSAQEFPVFVDMIEHPEAWRGQPVTLRGHLIRFISYDAGPNDFGIERLYEGWLVTDDSQTHPVTVIATTNPDDIPVGEELIDSVTVTGYFLKLHNYSSRDQKVRFAPMILAHALHWSGPPPFAPTKIPQLMRYSGLALLTLVIGRLIWRMRRPPGSLEHPRPKDELPVEASEFLKDLASEA